MKASLIRLIPRMRDSSWWILKRVEEELWAPSALWLLQPNVVNKEPVCDSSMHDVPLLIKVQQEEELIVITRSVMLFLGLFMLYPTQI